MRFKITYKPDLGVAPVFVEAARAEFHPALRSGPGGPKSSIDGWWVFTEKNPRLRIDTSVFRAFGDQVDRVDENPPDWPDEQSEQVLPLDIGCRPWLSGPDGVLVQGERVAALIFMCSRFDLKSLRYEDAGVASVKFRNYLATRYGWPNDEALMGHPLYPKGLVRADGVGEVRNSQWLKSVQLRNNLSFPRVHPFTEFASMRHFVIQFKEQLFECLAPTIEVAVQFEPFDSALARATSELD
jgi:hypothetical protein